MSENHRGSTSARYREMSATTSEHYNGPIIGRCRLISGRLHVCTWARCRPDVGNDMRPTSGRYRLDVGRCLKTIAVRCRPDIGKCRPRYRPDVGKLYRADIGKWLISGRLHVCTWARCRPDVVYDIRPTSGRYRLDVGRYLKTIAVRRRPDIGKCRPRYRPDVGKLYRADIVKCRLISGRLHVCTLARCRPDVSTISGPHLADIDSMSGLCLKTTEARYRPNVANDIRPTSGPCRKTTEARCRKRLSADETDPAKCELQ